MKEIISTIFISRTASDLYIYFFLLIVRLLFSFYIGIIRMFIHLLFSIIYRLFSNLLLRILHCELIITLKTG